MNTIKYKGALYVTANEEAAKATGTQKYFLVNVMGIKVLIPDSSASTARQKLVALLRPSKAWKSKDLKPVRVPNSSVARLTKGIVDAVIPPETPEASAA